MNRSPVQPPVVAVIVNPVHRLAMPALVAALRTVESLGWDAPLVLRTSVESPGGEQAREALAAGADRVLVIGGDGTVRLVAEVLAGTECVMGIVPTGTANLAARNLGLT